MSILDSTLPAKHNPADTAAINIINKTRQTFNAIAKSFNDGAKLFWDNDSATPQEIAEKLGANAKEIFELHYALGQLIANIKPEAMVEGMNLIGDFTINNDGTVTILDQQIDDVTPPNDTIPPSGTNSETNQD